MSEYLYVLKVHPSRTESAKTIVRLWKALWQTGLDEQARAAAEVIDFLLNDPRVRIRFAKVTEVTEVIDYGLGWQMKLSPTDLIIVAEMTSDAMVEFALKYTSHWYYAKGGIVVIPEMGVRPVQSP